MPAQPRGRVCQVKRGAHATAQAPKKATAAVGARAHGSAAPAAAVKCRQPARCHEACQWPGAQTYPQAQPAAASSAMHQQRTPTHTPQALGCATHRDLVQVRARSAVPPDALFARTAQPRSPPGSKLHMPTARAGVQAARAAAQRRRVAVQRGRLPAHIRSRLANQNHTQTNTHTMPNTPCKHARASLCSKHTRASTLESSAALLLQSHRLAQCAQQVGW